MAFALHSSPRVNAPELVNALHDVNMLLLVALAAVLGVIGAAARATAAAVKDDRGDPPPPPPKNPRLQVAVTGAIAAVAVLWLSAPSTAIAFIGGSLVAGYAGKAVLDALEAKVIAGIAQREAKVAVEQARLSTLRFKELAATAESQGGETAVVARQLQRDAVS